MTDNSDTLKIQSLNIKSIPGISHGIPAYEQMGEDVVLITGPNASGKSSTVRAIKHLLWQTDDSNFYDVSAKFHVEGKLWQIVFKNGELKIYKDGEKTEEELPKYEFPNRYSLSINDLFLSDETELAEQLQKELYGGVNIKDVYDSEEYGSKTYSTRKEEYKNYDKAKHRFKEVKKEQESLKKDQRKLDSLEEKQEKLKEEKNKLDLIIKALDYKNIKSELNQKKVALKAFDDIMEKLLTFPIDKLPQWKDSRQKAKEDVRQLEKEIDQLEDKLNKLQITHLDLEQLKLNELEELKDSIISLESDLQNQFENKNNAENKLKDLSQRLGYNKDEKLEEWDHYDRLKNIELADIGELDKLVQDYNQNLATLLQLKAKADAIAKILEKQVENEVEKADFQDGISSLTKWLKEKKAKNKINAKSLFIIAALCVVVGFFMYLNLQEIWVIIGIVAIAVTSIFLFLTSSVKNDQNIRKQDYRDIGFKDLEEWTIDAVSSKIDTLINQQQENYKTNLNKEEHNRLIKEYETQQNIVDGLINDISEHRNNIASTLQLDRRILSVNLIGNYVNIINDWKNDYENYTSSGNRIDELKKMKEEKIESFNEIIRETEFEDCETIEEIKATYSEISNQRNKSREYYTEKSSKEVQLEKANEDFKEYENRISQAFENLGKKEKDEVEVMNHLENIDKYKDIKAKISELRTYVDVRKKDYKETLQETEIDEDLMNYTVEQLEREKEACANASEELTEIRDEITTINTKIEEVKKKNDLADALKNKDEAEEDLMNLYRENLSKNIGDIILKKLQTHDQQENQPEILKRANELLSSITNGKYEVRMNTDSQNPEFMGYDTQKQRKIKLGELSSGTRIHLLLSLRIASIEQQEKRSRNWKMPIFADEILANSDEARSEAIINALIEISKSGRQVFYLTAQQDEIGKWTEHLRKQKESISFKAYQLSNKKNQESIELKTLEQLPQGISLEKNVPEPTSLLKSDYKERLRGHEMEVSEYNLLTDKPTELHLWYLIDDMNDLNMLLNHGVSRWGQLQSVSSYDSGYTTLIEKHKIEEKVTILKKYQSLNKVGKAKPVNRAILLDNKVTDNKIDDVTELMHEVGYNPVILIDRIAEISGIGSSTKEDIETSLIENGFIPTEEEIEKEEIERRILQIVKNMSINQSDAQSFLTQFIKDE